MPIHDLDETILDINDPYVIENLTSNKVRGVTYTDKITIQESIQSVISNSLSTPSNNCLSNTQIKESDTFILPDVHARLDLFAQNLFVAGLIDRDGNWIAQNKNVVFLGDAINRGPYSTETLVYMLNLQRQAKKSHSNFTILIGNHEFCCLSKTCIDFSNTLDNKVLRNIIYKSLQNGSMQFVYADNKKNILCLHAGMVKDELKNAIVTILQNTEAELFSKDKISSENIYKIMQKNKITIEDVAAKINDGLIKSMNSSYSNGMVYLSSIQSLFYSKKKNNCPDIYSIDSQKTYKVTQFVGHTTTLRKNHFPSAADFGAVKKINHTFFLDYDLLRGNRAFIAISNNDIYQVYSPENGLAKSQQTHQKNSLPIHLHETSGCYHGNTCPINISKWNVKLIAHLPHEKNYKNDAENIRKKMMSRKSSAFCIVR